MIYFAYGSNLNPGQMFDRCPGHQTIGVARLPGYRLSFPRFSPVRQCATAGLSPDRGNAVWGVLYRLTEEDLTILHYHEGYDPYGDDTDNRHRVMDVTVTRPGEAIAQTAITYEAIPDDTRERPSRSYIETIIEGARYHELPRAWIVFLQRIATQD